MSVSRARLALYLPAAQAFSAGIASFHGAVAARLRLHVTDLFSLRLLGKEPLTAGELGQYVGLTRPGATALIDRLEQAGYVARERGAEDGRQVTVRVKPHTLRQVNAIYEAQRSATANLLAKYSAEEFSVILHFLEHTASLLAEEEGKLPPSPVTSAATNRKTTAE